LSLHDTGVRKMPTNKNHLLQKFSPSKWTKPEATHGGNGFGTWAVSTGNRLLATLAIGITAPSCRVIPGIEWSYVLHCGNFRAPPSQCRKHLCIVVSDTRDHPYHRFPCCNGHLLITLKVVEPSLGLAGNSITSSISASKKIVTDFSLTLALHQQ